MRWSLLLTIVVATSLQLSCVAFDCTGHIFVAMVALQQVPPSVAAELQPLFQELAMRYTDVSTVAEAACFPDDMKSWTSQYSNWHYYDGCYSVGGAACPATPEGLLPVALAAAEAGLGNRSLSNAERGFWLAFVLHLVGDAHQPLHLCTEFSPTFPNGDLGGNKFYVDVEGDGNGWTALHPFLDDGLDNLLSHPLQQPIAQFVMQKAEFALQTLALIDNYTVPTSEATDLNFTHWQDEAMDICRDVVYGNLTNGSTVNASYVEAVQSMLRQRVAVGGARLATILTNALGDKGDSSSSSHTATYIAAGVVGGLVTATAGAVMMKVYLARRMRSRASLLSDLAEHERFYS